MINNIDGELSKGNTEPDHRAEFEKYCENNTDCKCAGRCVADGDRESSIKLVECIFKWSNSRLNTEIARREGVEKMIDETIKYAGKCFTTSGAGVCCINDIIKGLQEIKSTLKG